MKLQLAECNQKCAGWNSPADELSENFALGNFSAVELSVWLQSFRACLCV